MRASGLPIGQGQTSIPYELDGDDDSTVGDTLAGNVTREAVTMNGQAQPGWGSRPRLRHRL